MPRTTHEAIHQEILDHEDFEIRLHRRVLSDPESQSDQLASSRDALVQALRRKIASIRNYLRQGYEKAFPQQALLDAITACRAEVDFIKEVDRQAKHPVDPRDPYDEHWNDRSLADYDRILELLERLANSRARAGEDMDGLGYTVGYKRPPIEHRFKPGNPGGPGRPKGTQNIRALLIGELSKSNARMTRKIVQRLIKRATSGDVGAIQSILRITARKS